MCLGSPGTKGRSRLESGTLHTAGAEIIALHFVVSVKQPVSLPEPRRRSGHLSSQ